MLVSSKKLIEDEVMKNLLTAHERLADSGTVSEIIRLSKHILRLADKRHDVLVDVVAKDQEQRRDEPV